MGIPWKTYSASYLIGVPLAFAIGFLIKQVIPLTNSTSFLIHFTFGALIPQCIFLFIAINDLWLDD